MRIRNWITRPRSSRPKQPRQRSLAPPEPLEPRVLLAAFDVSPPAILQWFESSQETMIERAPDLFMAGYGAVWTPPPGRGDTSDVTVGYDVYDRFDLGTWDKHTLYGTETSLKRTADMVHRAGLDLHVDFVLNHNGYSDLSTPGFYDAGGYPGLAITLPNDIDGDFHSAYWGGPEYERLAGLIDIAHEKNVEFIRNPVDPNDSRNIRPGTTPAFGRIANIPDPENARFYPDIGHNTIFVYDPVTGEQNIPVHQFNPDDPLQGDATAENATGYLQTTPHRVANPFPVVRPYLGLRAITIE
jgi:alpha-amylase